MIETHCFSIKSTLEQKILKIKKRCQRVILNNFFYAPTELSKTEAICTYYITILNLGGTNLKFYVWCG